ncbi:MAG TPA: sigma-70 family RNA polymerase sigma factor [Pirellulales bacterium]|jgi:RNA polymerase sigma-70 factor (ECF subfamily)
MSDLDAIVTAHADAVWRTANRLLDNHDDALDCYQQTFLDALRMAKASEVRHWRTMLVRIATRRAIDRLRERYRRNKAFEGGDGTDQIPSAVEPPDARAQGEELREQIRRALTTLPAQQAEAFWLRHVEQLSAAEVAEQLGVDAGHVRVLVHRAATSLREGLGPTYGPASHSEDSA